MSGGPSDSLLQEPGQEPPAYQQEQTHEDDTGGPTGMNVDLVVSVDRKR